MGGWINAWEQPPLSNLAVHVLYDDGHTDVGYLAEDDGELYWVTLLLGRQPRRRVTHYKEIYHGDLDSVNAGGVRLPDAVTKIQAWEDRLHSNIAVLEGRADNQAAWLSAQDNRIDKLEHRAKNHQHEYIRGAYYSPGQYEITARVLEDDDEE